MALGDDAGARDDYEHALRLAAAQGAEDVMRQIREQLAELPETR